MKLSIIIPAYNSEKHIENCVKNIYNQKMNSNDYEIIIVNDGSKDKTKEIIVQLKKSYPNIVLINQSNQGSSVARNTGVNIASGEYIYFLDSDDYLANNTLSIVLQVASKRKPDIITFEAIRTSDLTLTKCKKNNVDINNIDFVSGQEYLEKKPEHRVEIWWYFLKREFLLKTGATFKKGVFHQDVIFTMSLFIEAQKVINLPLDVYRYYQSEGSSIRNKKPSHLKKIIDDYIILFNDVELFIKNITHKYPNISKSIISNINKRKQRDAFFMIIRVVRAKFTINILEKYLKQLTKSKAYPVPYSVADNQNNKIKYYLMIFIINHKLFLYSFLFFYRFSK